MSVRRFTVFTKPWRTLPVAELGDLVAALGFDGVELPIRPGFQVEPESVARGLGDAVRVLATSGVVIDTVSPPYGEAITTRMIEACAEAGVSLMRVCVGIPRGQSYFARIADIQHDIDSILPVLRRTGVAIGVQNHYGHDFSHALALRELVKPFDPAQVGAVWDPAHSALSGEIPAHAVEIIWPHLRMVNLKNAYWKRSNGPEALVAQWTPYWTAGRHGLAPWPDIVERIVARGYTGSICLPAEYSDESDLQRLVTEDLAFARSLFHSEHSAITPQ